MGTSQENGKPIRPVDGWKLKTNCVYKIYTFKILLILDKTQKIAEP